MLHIVDTGDLSYVYVSERDKIISAIPMHVKTMASPVKNFKLSAAYYGSQRSPKFRAMAARNTKLFNKNNYLSNNEYKKVIRKLLEILPGDKSRLFFGGDFTSLDSLDTVVKVAGELSYKTWMIASGDRSMLNNYWLNLICRDESLPTNVWLYEIETEEDDMSECLLHDFPVLKYDARDSDGEEDELLQFPEEYKNFAIKVCQ
jgi:hypothetical protein